MRLVRMFDNQTRESLLAMREYIEELTKQGSNEVAASTLLRHPEARLPSARDRELNDALDTAGDIALFYEADTPGSVSDVQVIFPDTGMCEMVIANKQGTPHLSLHMLISPRGISRIELALHAPSVTRRYPFSFLTPISKLEGRKDISSIFELFLSAASAAPRSSRLSTVPFLEGPLFKYLRECERRFGVLP